MEKFIEFKEINENNIFNYNEFITNINNINIQQECDIKLDFLLNGLLENRQNKRKL